MKKLYFIFTTILLTMSQTRAQNDSIYYWKADVVIHKQSIKPADLDSITFRRPISNLAHVTICNQIWTTKNLEVTTYSDGTIIPQVTDPTAWVNLTTGAWCYYNNGTFYGKLYNWYAVAGIYNAASAANTGLRKKLAPTGWHVPTDAEWTTLTDCLGQFGAGGKMKEAGTTHWNSPNTDATNSSGFTGLPGGYRFYNGTFYDLGGYGNWWSSSEFGTSGAWSRNLYYNLGDAIRTNASKRDGFSVRCLKD